MSVIDLIRPHVDALRAQGTGTVGVFIAGPIDEDYDPQVNNHHWEIATLARVKAIALVIDLNKCEIVEVEKETIGDCHGWLSLSTHGREHTLGVLIVLTEGGVNLLTPLNATSLSGGNYLPVAVTFIGRNEDDDFENVITQWHEELLKFVIGGVVP